ncbi:MAG: hypothetical protein ABIT76_02965 [Chthoniobacterales bacterium]
MAPAAEGTTRIPVKIADCFLLALDAFMRRTGQGAHFSQSVIELSSCPDLIRVRSTLSRFTKKHPLLFARLRRDWKTWLPYWEIVSENKRPPLPFGVWHESGSEGLLGLKVPEIEDGATFLEDRLSQSVSADGLPFNARLDIVEKRDGRYLVAFTWSHRVIDGKGAELLLTEFGKLCDGVDEAYDYKETPRSKTTLTEKRQHAHALLVRFDELAALGVHSLGGPEPKPGACRFQVLTLNSSDSAKVRTRADQLCGPLFSLPYYLACASRAHATVFRSRGKDPSCYVSGVPIQARKRGARGPLFHNQVSVFFFACLRQDISSMELAAAALKKQFTEMTRQKLDESFTTMLEIMMRMPSWLFMRIVRWQFQGEINSFFYSHTGVFAPEMTTFAGAGIENAWHLPCLGRPPGTGVFFSERNEKLTITLSWREGCLSEQERVLMTTQIIEDLLGSPQPRLANAV